MESKGYQFLTQAKSVVVPVDDTEVKNGLREHGQPACEWDNNCIYCNSVSHDL